MYGLSAKKSGRSREVVISRDSTVSLNFFLFPSCLFEKIFFLKKLRMKFLKTPDGLMTHIKTICV